LSSLWSDCLLELEHSLSPQQFNSWISPLQAVEHHEHQTLQLLAPNSFIFDWVRDKLWEHIQDAFIRVRHKTHQDWQLTIDEGQFNSAMTVNPDPQPTPVVATKLMEAKKTANQTAKKTTQINSGLNRIYTFDGFVQGKANQLANAAALQVASNPGGAYNPLFIYGGVGLGKTHLMHAIGNHILTNDPDAKVVYLSSERFVQDMVTAIRHQKIEAFKDFYRSLDALLIDDIQFFADKTGTQEEFFHTFNALLEGNKQVVLTSDKFPKEITGLEERLKSRFGWGLTIAVEPPEFEMRVAILQKKAAALQVDLPSDVAFLIAKRLHSNVRELEGALNRVIAFTQLTHRPLTVEIAKESLRDLIAAQERMVTLDNIQKTVADFYKLRVTDLTSDKRTRNLARPRQIAMFISKELTSHSLPEIGTAYKRDHTTVLHACRQVVKLRESDRQLDEEVTTLLRILRT
jgi:chromosomal replication initiator protein